MRFTPPEFGREVVTLDTNTLNRNYPVEDLWRAIIGRTVCVSDLVVAETLNSLDSHKWALDNFAKLYDYRRHVYCTHSLPHYMQIELDTGRPTTCVTTNRYATENFRGMIHNATKAPREARKQLDEFVPGTVEAMQDRQKMLHDNAAKADEVIGEVLEHIGLDEAAKIAQDVTLFPQLLADANFVQFVTNLIDLAPKPAPVDAELLAKSHCIWARYYYAVFAQIVKSHDRPPQVEQKPKKIHSDHNDGDIIITGSFTDRTLIQDKAAQYVDKAIRLCVQQLLHLKPKDAA